MAMVPSQLPARTMCFPIHHVSWGHKEQLLGNVAGKSEASDVARVARERAAGGGRRPAAMKNGSQMEPVREMAGRLMDQAKRNPSLVQFYVSKQWLNKFENFAEPGPIDNSDFLCKHGGVLPTKSAYCSELCVALPQPAWDLLRGRFGGGLPCTVLRECTHCRAELDALNRQKTFELEEFKALHAEFQEEAATASASGGRPQVVYCLSTNWFRQWEKFVTNRARDPPGPIDNHAIVVTSKHQLGSSTSTSGVGAAGVGMGAAGEQQQQHLPQMTLRQNSDYIQLSQDIWLMLYSIYGGGPHVLVRPNGTILVSLTGGAAIGKSGGSSSNSSKHLPALAARIRARTASESTSSVLSAANVHKDPPRPGMATRSKARSVCEAREG